MRDKNLSYLVFKEQFDKQSKRKIQKSFQDIKILRSAVTDSPTFLSEYYLVLPSSFRLIRGLCLVKDYLPEFLRWEVTLLLEEKILRFDYKKQKELKLLMSTVTRAKYLFFSNRYTSHQIFGTMIQDSIDSLYFLQWKERNKQIRYPQRKRGYDDKGTLRSFDIWSDKWKPSSDWSLTELQNEKERKIKRHWRALSLITTILMRIEVEEE